MVETLQPAVPDFNKSLRAARRADRLTGEPEAVLPPRSGKLSPRLKQELYAEAGGTQYDRIGTNSSLSCSRNSHTTFRGATARLSQKTL